jgi:hypothetical protein
VDSEKNHSQSSGRNANQTSLSVPYPALNSCHQNPDHPPLIFFFFCGFSGGLALSASVIILVRS